LCTGKLGDTLPKCIGNRGGTGQEKTQFRFRRSEDLDRSPKRTVVTPQWNDRHLEGQVTTVRRSVHGCEIFDPFEAILEGERQGTGIVAIHATRHELASTADFAGLLISQETLGGTVHVAKNAPLIENDDGLSEMVEDLEPGLSEEFSPLSGHASITAETPALFAIL
jgi:hypothetical protein